LFPSKMGFLMKLFLKVSLGQTFSKGLAGKISFPLLLCERSEHLGYHRFA